MWVGMRNLILHGVNHSSLSSQIYIIPPDLELFVLLIDYDKVTKVKKFFVAVSLVNKIMKP